MKVCDQVPVPTCRYHPLDGYGAERPKMGKGRRKEKPNYLDITGLIRSVQRSEGHSDCFRRGFCDCDQPDCSWRDQCF